MPNGATHTFTSTGTSTRMHFPNGVVFGSWDTNADKVITIGTDGDHITLANSVNGRVGIGALNNNIASSKLLVVSNENVATAHFENNHANGKGVYIKAGSAATDKVLEVVNISDSSLFRVMANGQAYVNGALVQTSDRRLKKEIKTLENTEEKLAKITGVEYYWKDLSKSLRKQVGVIAQDVQSVYPELVDINEETGFLAVNYSGLIGPLIEVTNGLVENKKKFNMMQEGIDLEQNRKIAALNERVEELEIQNDAMKEFLCVKFPEASMCQ